MTMCSCAHGIQHSTSRNQRLEERLFVGGHVLDSSKLNACASTISDISVCLQFLIAMGEGISLMVGGVGNTFPTAPVDEKM